MAITIDDFSKIWASTSPLTPYSFSESNYKEGWNFVGGTPPSRQMWDFIQKQNDEKLKYLLDNFNDYLPLAGGAMTGVLTLADGGSALSDATVGKYYSASWTATTSSANSTVLTNSITNIPIGTYLVIGKLPFCSTSTFTIALSCSGGIVVPDSSMGTLGLMATSVLVVKITNATNLMRLVSAQSATCNFSYLERGGIVAIRIV